MNLFHQFLSFFGLLDKTFGQQVHACYSLPEWQAVTRSICVGKFTKWSFSESVSG